MTAYNNENIFAKIIKGEAKAEKIYEDEKLIAIRDIFPAAPVHVLVIPKGEYVSFADFVVKAGDAEVAYFFRKIGEIAKLQGLEENGFRLITNHGAHASQTVPHFHVHIIGGRSLGGLVPNDAKIR